jgi:carboxymethylenebutenolidase
MGGGFALLCAPSGFAVAAANYGQAPSHPADHFRDSCPVVASYGGRDPLMMGQAKRVEKGLARAGVLHDLKVYPGAGHSFLNDEMTGPRALQPIERVLNVGPRPDAAKDAWARIETYFARHLAD